MSRRLTRAVEQFILEEDVRDLLRNDPEAFARRFRLDATALDALCVGTLERLVAAGLDLDEVLSPSGMESLRARARPDAPDLPFDLLA